MMNSGDAGTIGRSLGFGFQVDRVLRVVTRPGGWESGDDRSLLCEFANTMRSAGGVDGWVTAPETSLLLSSAPVLNAAASEIPRDAGDGRALAQRLASVLDQLSAGEVPRDEELRLLRVVLSELARLSLDDVNSRLSKASLSIPS
jgi:hypothetical protein